MPSQVRIASPTLNKILRFIFKRYFRYRYNMIADIEKIKDIKGPFLLLANHINNWDPFFINAFVEEPIHYVASDEQFRNPIKGFVLTHVFGAIPKKKFVSDMESVKAIIKVVRSGHSVGIFPEGQRNWNGETGTLLFSTAKLIKLLKIPLITVKIKGAHLTHPRWATKDRIGKIELDYDYILSPEEIGDLSEEAIHKKLEHSVYHDEIAYQEVNMVPYKGKNLAERLELYLFTCAKCNTIGSLKSKNNTLCCEECNYSVVYNEYGYLENSDMDLPFSYPGQWDKWQLSYLTTLFRKAMQEEPQVLLEDKDVTILIGNKLMPLRNFAQGTISLDTKVFSILADGITLKSFKIEKLSGINVQYNNEFEFYYDKALYRFKFKNKSISSYKWVSSLEILQRLITEKKVVIKPR
ncbi:lysophospholipid acyltransferase family protein [Clostridium thermarum]|uniref:lysophospholipid acyltransferase family protein n=1 Tax=Clostridium thermarum TaxID=1716543 RepID=UPI0013D30DB7|nr:lysophospholipid acyltransferase family protein [Clostridium thermarum]